MASSRLILVRHAAVEPRPEAPAHSWELSEDGRIAAARLASLRIWRDVALLASSPEPKAVATAEPIAAAWGLEPRIEPDLREAGRPFQPLVDRDEYVALARAYLDGADVDGWEPATEVRARVTACVERLVAEADGAVAAVSHGLALSFYLGLAPDEWERIPFPGLAVVDPETRRVLEPWRAA